MGKKVQVEVGGELEISPDKGVGIVGQGAKCARMNRLRARSRAKVIKRGWDLGRAYDLRSERRAPFAPAQRGIWVKRMKQW